METIATFQDQHKPVDPANIIRQIRNKLNYLQSSKHVCDVFEALPQDQQIMLYILAGLNPNYPLSRLGHSEKNRLRGVIRFTCIDVCPIAKHKPDPERFYTAMGWIKADEYFYIVGGLMASKNDSFPKGLTIDKIKEASEKVRAFSLAIYDKFNDVLNVPF